VRDLRAMPVAWFKRTPSAMAMIVAPPPGVISIEWLRRGLGVVGEGESAESCERKSRLPLVAFSGLTSQRPLRGLDARGARRERAELLALPLLPSDVARAASVGPDTTIGIGLFE
jgi:hypothetical protein